MSKYFKPDIKNCTPDELRTLIDTGYTLLCPKCGKELTVALTLDKAKELQIHPGVYCQENPKHFHMMVELAEAHRKFWNKFDKWMEENKINEQKEDK